MMTRNPKRLSLCGGMGLIELLVSILVSLIVIAAVTSLVLATLRMDTETLRMTRLTQDMRSVMALVTRDIRRAGYWPHAIEDIGTGASLNPHDEITFDDLDLGDGLDAICILYSYHEEEDNAGNTLDPTIVEAPEREGFRLDPDNLWIEAADPISGPTDCDTDSGWITLTDDLPGGRVIEITELAFRTVDSDPFATAGGVTIREIVVSLEGRLADDPAVTRRIEETIRVRNDWIN